MEKYLGNFDGYEVMIDDTITPGKMKILRMGDTCVLSYPSEEEFKSTSVYKNHIERCERSKIELHEAIMSLAEEAKKRREKGNE